MVNQLNGTVTLLAGGDIGPTFEPVDELAEFVLPVLRQADLRFAQCERVYSERGVVPEFTHGRGARGSRQPLRMASIWKTADIDIISMAGNHVMDWGPEPVFDTMELFRSMGKNVIGAGKDADEARKPAIVEHSGVKIAFLAYCSVLRDGHQAGKDKAGCAPMRAHTHYVPEDFQPGVPPRVVTVPHEEDLKQLEEDIKKAKQQADVVVMSIHWGLHHIPKTICDYQPIVAHAAIDAGADLILGHHPHILKAIEVYKGKVCFYSVGNFLTTGFNQPRVSTQLSHFGGFWWYQVDPEYMPPQGKYGYPPDARKAMMVKAVFSKKGVERISFLPLFINSQAQPQVVAPSDPKFQEILEFTEWISDRFPHRLRVDGNEIVVEA